jgi:hypothetical protein
VPSASLGTPDSEDYRRRFRTPFYYAYLRQFELIPDSDSHLRLIAPTNVVGATAPPSDPYPLPNRREQRDLRLESPEHGKRDTIEVSLLSPYLQSARGASVAQLGLFNWFAIAVAASIVALLAFTRRQLWRLIQLLMKRLRQAMRSLDDDQQQATSRTGQGRKSEPVAGKRSDERRKL